MNSIAQLLQNEARSIDYLQIYGMNLVEKFWQVAVLDNTLAHSAGLSMIKMRSEKNLRLRLHESLDAYLSTLSHNSRRMVRRHSRNYFKDPASRLERVTKPEHVSQLIDWMTIVDRDSWQAKAFGIDHTNDTAYRKFLEQVASQGWLRSYVLLRGDEPVAYKHNYQYSGVLFSDRTAYRHQYSSTSPGIVLTYGVLQDIHADHSVDFWDFGFGDLQYRRTFCSEVNDVAIVYFVPRNRWRLILRLQQLFSFADNRVRSMLIRLKLDRFLRSSSSVKSNRSCAGLRE